jgi:hypothetical protein
MTEFYEKQRTNLNGVGKVKKNAMVNLPETDLQRMLRQNKKQVELLPEHLQVIALRILNDESEIQVMTDKVKDTCKTTRDGIHHEVVDIATKLHEIYEAEKKFN